MRAECFLLTIDIFPCGVISFHNSYLPYNRGKYPHVWAIYNELKYGVSLHYIDEDIDTGDIIARREMKIEPTDIASTLYERSLEEIVELFKVTWPRLNKISSIPQGKGVHHFAKEVGELDVIDLDKTYKGRDIINQLRARSFKDRSYVYYMQDGKKIFIRVSLSTDQ